MTAEQRMNKAFKTFCAYLDGRNLKYDTEKTESGSSKISLSGKGKDLTISFSIFFDVKNELISLLSQMPFDFKSDKMIEGALACAIVSDNLREGSFDFNIANGRVFYRLTNTVKGMDVSRELCEHIFEISTLTVDNYNDKLFMVAKGMMTTQEFYDKIKG